jgi:cytoskeletal protein CcmA (bactofilin family)
MEQTMAEVRIKDIDEHEIDTILAEDIDFEGHLSFKKPLMIKGKFKGEIKSTSALYIGEKAYVEASTEAGIVSSKGTHKGDIVGHSRVELFSTAKVDGDITTPDFVVESGCKFNGHCNMGGGPVKKDAAHAAQGQPVGAPPASGQPSNAQPANASPQGQGQHGPQPQQPQGPQGSGQQGGQRPQGQPSPQQGQQQKPANPGSQGGGQQR